MLTEIEFELPAEQFEAMKFPRLTQGQPLTAILDADILLPDPAAYHWFHVQKEPLPPTLVPAAPATYAFTGQIVAADLTKADGMETATVLIQSGDVYFRAVCGPDEDGRLPFGTWETRTIVGLAHLRGIIEDDFSSPIGRPVDMTIWQFRRLLLRPGDARFGEWYTSAELLDSPYRYDRIFVQARLHRSSL